MAKKMAHGVGFLGQQHSSDTPLSLNSSGDVVRDAELEYDDESNHTNLRSYSSHQTTVSQQGVGGLDKEIDRGVSGDTSSEFRLLPDSPKQEAGDECQESLEIQDQERPKKRAGAAGLQDSLEVDNTRALSRRPNEKKKAFIRKVLSESDVSSHSRVHVNAMEVLKALRVMNSGFDKIWESNKGVPFKIFDTQTRKESTLALKRSHGRYFFSTGWKTNFVNDRKLNKGDEIELAWNDSSQMFDFSVTNKAGPNTRD